MSCGQMFGHWRESALVLKAQATKVTGRGFKARKLLGTWEFGGDASVLQRDVE